MHLHTYTHEDTHACVCECGKLCMLNTSLPRLPRMQTLSELHVCSQIRLILQKSAGPVLVHVQGSVKNNTVLLANCAYSAKGDVAKGNHLLAR